jgi:glycosyltransferase involved in cell wall biosynthesis
MGSRPATILHTIQTGGPGGAETLVVNLAAGLDSTRFRSVVFCPDGSWLPGQLRSRDIPFRLASSPHWHDPRLSREMVRMVREENVSLIHAHLPGQNFCASLVGTLLRRPVVATYHGQIEVQRSNGWISALHLQTVRRAASAFVVVSDQMRRALENAGFSRDRVVRIYNGIEPKRFDGDAGGSLRRELGLSEEAPLIGMVANIRPPKGHEHFIRAARMVADRFPAARFVAAGEHLAGLSDRLQALVAELKLQDRFFFLGFRDDVPAVLRDLDLFVLPSTSEGFPFVALEAMAAGRPSVMTRCGGPEEIVIDGVNGFLVPPADPEALAEKICLLLASPERARMFGQAAQARVREEFSRDAMLTQYEDLYDRLLNRRSPTAAVNDVTPVAPPAR